MSLFLFIPLFIAAAFLAFYIPGRVILGEQKNLSKVGIFAASFILGIVLWGWQGYIFGFLQLRSLSYLYLLIFLIIFIKRDYLSFKFPKIQFNKVDLIVVLIAAIGIFGQTIAFVKTGQISSEGLFISTYNSCDHIWHAALAGELAGRFPPNEPGLSGIVLTNYNFWFHLVTGEFSRVFNLPLLLIQSAGIYPMASILLAIIGYVFAVNLYNSKFFSRVFLFFLFFAGDAIGWLYSLFKHNLILNISLGFDDATKFMDTPGYGLSVIIALTAFYIFLVNKQKLTLKNILIIALLIGSLIGFKVYMGIPLLLGFFFLSLYGVVKKNFSYLPIFITASILSAAQFLPFNAGSGGLFFLLLEVPRGFMAQKSLGLGFIDQRWTIYLENHNYLRLFEYGLIMTVIYLFVQFGVKLLGFYPLKRTIKILKTDLFILLYSILFSSLILGLFFYQRVGGGNIWQFFLATSLMLTILASLNLSILLSKLNKIIVTIIIVPIIIFTIPSWINFVSSNFQTNYTSLFHGVSTAELNVYSYLKNNAPRDSMILLIDQPNYGNCPASLAKVLTERNLFFSGPGSSQIITPENIRREKDVILVKNNTDDKKTFELLRNDAINYVVIYSDTFVATGSALPKNKLLNKVFSNETAEVFKAN